MPTPTQAAINEAHLTGSKMLAAFKDVFLPYQQKWILDDNRFKIGMWSRQTGKSFTTGFEAYLHAFAEPGSLWVTLSSGERQALEWMYKARKWAEVFDVAIDAYAETRTASQSIIKQAEISLPNGSRIVAIPSNPATARGYSGNVILDEFATHEKPNEIWAAVFPIVSSGTGGKKRLRVVSTPKGRSNKFAELWYEGKKFTRHKVTIEDAVQDGFPMDIDGLRDALGDPEIFAQEYMCEMMDSSSVLLPYQLLIQCEGDVQYIPGLPVFVGIDIGRRKDLTVIASGQRMPDGMLRIFDVQEFAGVEFRTQKDAILDRCKRDPNIQKVYIDATGIGAMLAEELQHELGTKITGVNFSVQIKAELFPELRRRFEDRTILIPQNIELREDLHSVNRCVSISGKVTYSAPRNADGHADRATALALCVAAEKCASVYFRPMVLGEWTGPNKASM